MPVKLNRLVAVKIPRLSKPGRYADGGGLFLSVRPNGTRRWVFLYQAPDTKRQREMGVGGQTVSLAEARERRRQAAELLAKGLDPIDHKHAEAAADRSAAANAMTFGAFATDYLKTLNYSNEKHRAQWSLSLLKHAEPLRDLPLKDITAKDVIDVLTPIFERTRETATRTRARIEKVLGVAAVYGHREGSNPARWTDHLVHVFSNRGQRTNRHEAHHAALPYQLMPAFMADLRKRHSVSARALEFTILCAARTGETISGTWAEVDFNAQTWTIDGSRMKAGRTHVVPLCERAIHILKSMLLPDGQPHNFIFRGADAETPLSNMAMLQMLRGLRDGCTVHGMRSAFSDWTGDKSEFDSETREFALAHIKGDKAEAAYRRSTSFDKRRLLMEAWEKFLASGK